MKSYVNSQIHDNSKMWLKEKYIESAYKSDGKLVRDIFHEDSKITGHIKGKLLRQSKEDWAKFVENHQPSPKQKGEEKHFDIHLVDVGKETAVAKVKSSYIDMVFMDTLSFIKLDGKWFIYNKIFETVE